MTNRRKYQLALTAVVLFLGAPVVADEEPAADNGPLFYPLPPDEPRFQFLAKFSSALDVSSRKQGFRDFVFGGDEHEGHLVDKPYGIAVHDGAIYVVDTRGSGWGVFDLKNRRSQMVRPAGGGTLRKPINISIDQDGTKYVTDTVRKQIVVFGANNKYIGSFGNGDQFNPVDVAIADDKLYLTDIDHHQVHVLDKLTGKLLQTIGEAGSGEGQLFQPTNLTIAGDGSVYVVDTGNFRIQQFAKDGSFVRTMGQIGTGPGTFSRPKGIAMDRDGHVYVVDSAFENVQVLHPDDGALMFFGKPGSERDSINLPTAVKIDYDNIEYFQQYVAPEFEVEYLVLVASQFGVNKVSVFAYGSLRE